MNALAHLPCQRRVLAAALSVAALAGALPVAAAAIVGINVINHSSASRFIDETLRVREFNTASSLVASTAGSDSASFQHRMAWHSGHRVESGAPFTVLSWSNSVAYDLAFTVEDPLLRGYTLGIDSLMRGFVTALWEGTDAAFAPLAFAAGTLMTASLDSGAGFVSVAALATEIEVAVADDATPFENLLVDKVSSFDAGSFVGTHDFTLRYATIAANTNASLGLRNFGEVGVRFGIEPGSTRFQSVGYPAADGEAAAAHGHFVTVTANYGAVREVPEPASLALAGLALAMLGSLRRHRRC